MSISILLLIKFVTYLVTAFRGIPGYLKASVVIYASYAQVMRRVQIQTGFFFLYLKIINLKFFQIVIPVFVHILSAPLYTITIAWVPLIYQKEFVIACPAIDAQKV
jgi:hypothetical protein